MVGAGKWRDDVDGTEWVARSPFISVVVMVVVSFISSHIVLTITIVVPVAGLLTAINWFVHRRNQSHIDVLEESEDQVSAQTLGELLMLTPSEFEVAIAHILEKRDYYQMRRVGGAGYLGVDIVCRDDQGQKVVVQCKRYAPGRRVGSPDLQSFLGMMPIHHQAQSRIFVTTSTFSESALDLASQHPVTLIDGD